MNDVFILGAGFSKAIYADMPTMAELSTEVMDHLSKLDQPVPQTLAKPGANIELWMAYLSQRQAWLEVYGSALAQATRVFILGYSLPVSDLGMRFFLTANQPSPSTPTFVVDINKELPTHYDKLLPDLEVRTEFVGQTNAVEDFARQYGNMAGRVANNQSEQVTNLVNPLVS